MTKPNLDEKRDALAEAHANPQGVWDYADGQQVADFVAGWNAALAALREVNEAKDARIAELTSEVARLKEKCGE